MDNGNFDQRDPNKDPKRSKYTFYFGHELADRLKRRQSQMEALNLPFKVDYMVDAAVDWSNGRFDYADVMGWRIEQVVRKVPGFEMPENPQDRTSDDAFEHQIEFLLTKYLDYLDGAS